MLSSRLLFFVQLITFFCVLGAVSSTESMNETVPRSRRAFDAKYLVFPRGSNVQLVYCLTVVNYAKPSGFSTFGITAGQAWELPSDSKTFRKYLPEVYHRRSRRELYRKMESLLGTEIGFPPTVRRGAGRALTDVERREAKAGKNGKDGKACVLKAICDTAARNHTEVGEGTFLEEILHTVFTLPESFHDADPETEYERAYFRRENCEQAANRCPGVF